MSVSDKQLRRVNRGLLTAIIICNAYLLLTPFWPTVTYQVKARTSQPLHLANPNLVTSIDRSSDRLIIPRLRFEEPILEGKSSRLVNQGVWRRPQTSTPDQGSNTVLVGHRFSYRAPAVFYHLDKVALGDDIMVVWQRKLYRYEVKNIQTVPAHNSSVESASTDKRLTIYTCTPLWSTKNRLVVTAQLEKVL